MLGAARPQGYHVNRLYRGKIKMMNFTVLPQPNMVWANVWGSQYSATRNLNWLTTAAKDGFNAIRIFTGNTLQDSVDNKEGGGTPWPSNEVFRVRAAEFAQQCRSLGLLINPTMSGAACCPWGRTGLDYAAMLPRILAYAQIWVDVASDIIFAFDAINEMNIDHPTTWVSDGSTADVPSPLAVKEISQYVKDLRTVTRRIPLSVSITTFGPGMLLNSDKWLDLQYDLGCDFHDIHCYWGSTVPELRYFKDFEARTKFIGLYCVSEFGTSANIADSLTKDILTNLGTVMQTMPNCKCLGFWCIAPQNVNSSGDYGYTSDVAGLNPRPVRRENSLPWPSGI